MSFGKISRLLIANRGEIACRIAKSAKLFGCHVIGVYSDVDQSSLHVSMMDEAYNIGRAPVQESYLNISNLLHVAELAQADAVHPGYGFLSESVEFCQACHDSKLVFVGPPVSAIRDMGIKNKSKAIMASAGVPIIQGYHGDDQSNERLRLEAEKIGYPIMIKAVRGGGGKGMRIAMRPGDFEEQLAAARRESLKAFNNDEMLIEKYVQRPRHVEVQVFGDHHGNYVYLWERDCSIQRRHQKILEEAPAPGLRASVRKALGEAAVAAARAVNYVGAGTVEFVMDPDQNFYFMEMNTRLQVEHPITEAITGTDLVYWQLKVANGDPLPITKQEQIPLLGHAFETRIYAEDCSNPEQMMPTAGHLGYVRPPPNSVSYTTSSTNVRVDTGVRSGDEISVHYDPMIAKLVIFGQTREDALQKLCSALGTYHIAGLPTNVSFLRKLIQHPGVLSGDVHTDFIPQHLESLRPIPKPSIQELQCVAAIWTHLEPTLLQFGSEHVASVLLGELLGFRLNLPSIRSLKLFDSAADQSFTLRVTYPKHSGQSYFIELVADSDVTHSSFIKLMPSGELSTNDGTWYTQQYTVELIDSEKKSHSMNLTFACNLDSRELFVFNDSTGVHASFKLPEPNYMKATHSSVSGNEVTDPSVSVSPMPGVIERIFVQVGDKVQSGQALMTLIAMKMEYTVRSQLPGSVECIDVKVNDTVSSGQLLARIKTGEP